MQITVHRGSRQIGGSCIEVDSGTCRILLDIGLPLESQDLSDSEGPELVETGILPDIPGIYTWDERDSSIDAILISHPHLDHYGILQFVKPSVTVYMGSDAWAIIGKAAQFVSSNLPFKGEVYPIESGMPFAINGYAITPYLMDHSAFDAYAFHVTDNKTSIIYTGDFRAHGRKKKAFDWFLNNAPKNVDALILEGTMLSRISEDVETETELEEDVVSVISKTAGITYAYCSGQNIDRLVSFYRAAKRTGRLFVVDIYTAHILATAGKDAQIPRPGKAYPDIRVYYPYWLSKRVSEADKKQLLYDFQPYKISRDEIREKASRIVMLIRPSVKSDLERINAFDNATLIYSLWSGYLNDKYTADFIDRMEGQGVTVEHLHTSGHATLKDLKRTVKNLQPKSIIPIHTQAPEVMQQTFANVRMIKDKKPFEI